MHSKVNLIRALHEMSGIPKNKLSVSQTHWQERQKCAISIFIFRIIFQNRKLRMSIIYFFLIYRFYQCLNGVSIHANNFQTFDLFVMRCFCIT